MVADVSPLLSILYASRNNNLFQKHFECLLQFLFPSHFIKFKLWDIPLTSFSGGARDLGSSKSQILATRNHQRSNWIQLFLDGLGIWRHTGQCRRQPHFKQLKIKPATGIDLGGIGAYSNNSNQNAF